MIKHLLNTIRGATRQMAIFVSGDNLMCAWKPVSARTGRVLLGPQDFHALFC